MTNQERLERALDAWEDGSHHFAIRLILGLDGVTLSMLPDPVVAYLRELDAKLGPDAVLLSPHGNGDAMTRRLRKIVGTW